MKKPNKKKDSQLTLEHFNEVAKTLRRIRRETPKSPSSLSRLSQSGKKMAEEAVEVSIEATRLSENQGNRRKEKEIQEALIRELAQMIDHLKSLMRFAGLQITDIKRVNTRLEAELLKKRPAVSRKKTRRYYKKG